MTTEQINLATVKDLIDSARQLKSQLTLMGEQLDRVTKERDALSQKVHNQDMQFARDKDDIMLQHSSEMQSLRSELEKQITALQENSQSELAASIASYEAKIKKVTDELTQKNTRLLKELQQTQESHKAVMNRIRGLSA